MIYLTLIARVIDGLPLSSAPEEETSTKIDMARHKASAKALFKRLSDDATARCSLETGDGYCFHYLIEGGVVYLCLTELSYPKKLAFSFLHDLQVEFDKQYGGQVSTVDRPWPFIHFETFIGRTKRAYLDSRSQSNLNKLTDELTDVQRIMIKNIDDVIQRGESLDSVSAMAGKLAATSQEYRKAAKHINWMSFLRKWAPLAIIFLTLAVVVYIRLYWW